MLGEEGDEPVCAPDLPFIYFTSAVHRSVKGGGLIKAFTKPESPLQVNLRSRNHNSRIADSTRDYFFRFLSLWRSVQGLPGAYMRGAG